MADTKDLTIHFSRKMQGKLEDIARQLPEAFGDRPMKTPDEGRFEIREDAAHKIVLEVTQLEEKTLGALELPMQRLDFHFDGYGEDQVEAIMEHFDTCTLRVGGGP